MKQMSLLQLFFLKSFMMIQVLDDLKLIVNICFKIALQMKYHSYVKFEFFRIKEDSSLHLTEFQGILFEKDFILSLNFLILELFLF
jgi:hypothetical protein